MKSSAQMLFEAWVSVFGKHSIYTKWHRMPISFQEQFAHMAALYAEALSKAEGSAGK